MGREPPRLQLLESQATPLRWAFLETLAVEYPARMSAICEVALAVEPYIAGEGSGSRSMILRAIAMQLQNYQCIYPALNKFSVGLGLVSPSKVSPEFRWWFAEAALVCAGHAAASTEPAQAVAETARDESNFTEWSYIETSEDPLPEVPEYNPGVLKAKEYLRDVGAYMAAVEAWHSRRGAMEITPRPALDKHLTWLAWALVEGLLGPAIAQRDYDRADSLSREADGGLAPSTSAIEFKQVTSRAVNKAIWTDCKSVAQIIGLMRNSD